jgi:pyruvate-formate lyase
LNNRKGIKFLILILVLAAIMSGCVQVNEEKDRSLVIAEVNGEQIKKGEILDQYHRGYGEPEEYDEEIMLNILNSLIENKLVKQKAASAGYIVDEDVRKRAQEDYDQTIRTYGETLRQQAGEDADPDTDYEQKAREELKKIITESGQTEEGYLNLLAENIAILDFLSSVIDDCLATGRDVTQGGAHYNFAGVQAIQAANVADSLAAIKALVYDEKKLTAQELLDALKTNFENAPLVRSMLVNKVPKYGNDIEWVDQLGAKWVNYFADGLKKYRNGRGGIYQMGLYTVSAHVPMGQNVAASADGRYSQEPLADGGVSAMAGRDTHGPTALLQSVARLPFEKASNGTLLNMKFLPRFFKTDTGIFKFTQLLRAVCRLGISHVQFNVLNEEDLLAAQKYPDRYRGLTVRVAGYTAYFTELAKDLQDEIIARTTYEAV